jgi:protein gp37
MGKSKSDSEWWDESVELVSGCTPVSESCEHCWSAANTHRFRGRLGLTDKGHFNGRVIFNRKYLPRLSKGTGKRIVIWNDFLHEQVPFVCMCEAFDIIRRCPTNTYLVLTKRPERLLKIYQANPDYDWPIAQNLQVGVTVENQPRLDERGPILLQIPAAVRFVSCTLMGPIDFSKWLYVNIKYIKENKSLKCNSDIHQIIIECERLPGNRAGRGCEDEGQWWAWAADIVYQCKAANVAVWFKQGPHNGKVVTDMNLFPPGCRLREYPN